MRLGLDIGVSSIGWWLYGTHEETSSDGKSSSKVIGRVIDAGVRIFPDGRDSKSEAPLARKRREIRSARRRRDRYLHRRSSLMGKLVKAGLMPEDRQEAKKLERLDPYQLRAEGLDKRLSLHHFGRALFHLNQRRGFKSNRKTDRGDNESGKIKDATARLDQAMMAEKARTYGEFLHHRQAVALDLSAIPSVRTRLSDAQRGSEEKEKSGYDFYPDRRHYEEEFNKLWATQAEHHQAILTEELREELRHIIFFQRPLKPPKVGLCLYTHEKRIAKAHPLTQRRVLYETVNNLRITADGRKHRSLTSEQRDKIIHALDNKKPTKSPASMNMELDSLGTAIKLAPGERFTLETANREKIACDPVRASLSHPERFGPRWSEIDLAEQWEIVQRIQSTGTQEEEERLLTWLMETYGFDREHVLKIANAPLPEGYARLGETATRCLLDELMKPDVLTYNKAVEACGWHHSDHRSDKGLDALPYYGALLEHQVLPGTGGKDDDEITRYGRITNPTVHIGLNQIRRLVNKIISVHGKPDEIVVELARDLKNSKKQKDKINEKNKENRKAAERRSEKLRELGQADNGWNRMLLRLYEDLGPAVGPRLCPYTGKPISYAMLFDGSCDDDHILPWKRTLDDGFSNRTLCLREANREKRDQTPWEAWGDTPQWGVITANIKNLPKNKQWRFAPDAMNRFDEEGGFLARALVDTQYLSSIARTYLDALYAKDEGAHVWVVPGRMTAMLRRHWGLDSLLSEQGKADKNRHDHRHHAIDAAVIAATDRGLLSRISKAAGRDEGDGLSAERVARKTPEPWQGFRADINSQLAKIIVSHRANRGQIDPEARKEAQKKGRDSTSGQLHNDSAYGIVDAETVVKRVSFMALKRADIADPKSRKTVRDPVLREALLAAMSDEALSAARSAIIAEAEAEAEAAKDKDDKKKSDKKEISKAAMETKAFERVLRAFAAKEGPYHNIRRIRLTERMKDSSLVKIAGSDGEPYKAYKGDSNYCYEIWRLPNGKFISQVITTFEAHNGGFTRRPHPGAKRILRIFKRDMVAIEQDGKTIICYVQKLGGTGLSLVPHTEANADARNRAKEDPFKFIVKAANPLMKAGIRCVFVDEMGRLRDPGPTASGSTARIRHMDQGRQKARKNPEQLVMF